jgi:hypothetical protein
MQGPVEYAQQIVNLLSGTSFATGESALKIAHTLLNYSVTCDASSRLLMNRQLSDLEVQLQEPEI